MAQEGDRSEELTWWHLGYVPYPVRNHRQYLIPKAVEEGAVACTGLAAHMLHLVRIYQHGGLHLWLGKPQQIVTLLLSCEVVEYDSHGVPGYDAGSPGPGCIPNTYCHACARSWYLH